MLIKSVKRLFNNLKDRNNILSFFLGLSLVFAYAPFSQWWLALIIPALWFNLIDRKSVKIATKQGFFFGLGWFCSGISWVHVSIDQFGGLPLAISLLLMLFLCIYLALYPAIACYLSARLAQNKQLNMWLLPAFWLISEYLRSEVLTGFPWLSLGYSQIDGPLAAYAPVIGEIGITCLILIINILIFKLIFKVKQQVPLVNILHFTSLLIIILLTFSLQNISWVTPTNKSITTALVQANITQDMKWAPEQEWPTMLKFLELCFEMYMELHLGLILKQS